LQIQAKLLRVLENGQLTRLGGSKPLSVNVRIIAATHKDLASMAQDGSFRHDLWYRLCAFVLRVPALEERREDIPLLARSFLQRVCAEMSISRTLAPSALDSLSRRSYPGNIRELKHLITRAAVLSDAPAIDADVIARVTGASQPQPQTTQVCAGGVYDKLDFRCARLQFEKDYLNSALTRNDNNITTTAAAIGMAQSNLSRKLKELGLR
jgi:two-component system nitrogen regulation response regulator NtrX